MLDRILVAATVAITAILVPARAHSAIGKATAKVSGGKLKITGTAHDEGIQLDQVGLGPGQFRILPLEGTRGNGSSVAIVVSGVTGDVKIDLGGGSDHAGIHDASVAGKITMIGDSGDDFLWVGDVATTGGIKFVCGPGDDAVAVSSSSPLVIGGKLVIDGGTGQLDVTVIGTQLEVMGDASIHAGSRDDAVDFGGAHVHGNVKFQLGPGAASLDVGAIELLAEDGDNDFRVRNCSAGGSLTYNVGAPGRNDDDFELTGDSITGPTRIELGKDVNHVFGQNSNVDALQIVGKQKSDVVELYTLTCDAGVEVLLAGGANQVTFLDSTLLASLAIHTGSGDEVIDTTGTTVSGSIDTTPAAGRTRSLRDGRRPTTKPGCRDRAHSFSAR